MTNQSVPPSEEKRSIADVAKARVGGLIVWAGTVLALSAASVTALSFGIWLYASKYLDPAMTAALMGVTFAIGTWATMSFSRQHLP